MKSTYKDWQINEYINLGKQQQSQEFQKMIEEFNSILKEGCGIAFVLEEQDFNCGDDFEYEDKVKVALCPVCLERINKFQELLKEVQGDKGK